MKKSVHSMAVTIFGVALASADITASHYTPSAGGTPPLSPVPDSLKPDNKLTRITPQEAGVKSERRLVLGILAKDVPDVVRSQLALDGFPGVVVDALTPGGPAERAGVQRMDIVLKVGEKPIGAPDDLLQALRNSYPGDQVPLEIIRNGQRTTLSVTLDAKFSTANPSATPSAPYPPTMAQDTPSGTSSPRPSARDLRAEIERRIGAGRFNMPDNGEDAVAIMRYLNVLLNSDPQSRSDIDRNMEMMEYMARAIQDRVTSGNNAMPRSPLFPGPRTQHSGLSTQITSMSQSDISIQDNEGSIQIKGDSQNGTVLTVRDTQGNVLYSGPFNTPQDRKNLPPNIQKRVSKIRFSGM